MPYLKSIKIEIVVVLGRYNTMTYKEYNFHNSMTHIFYFLALCHKKF